MKYIVICAICIVSCVMVKADRYIPIVIENDEQNRIGVRFNSGSYSMVTRNGEDFSYCELETKGAVQLEVYINSDSDGGLDKIIVSDLSDDSSSEIEINPDKPDGGNDYFSVSNDINKQKFTIDQGYDEYKTKFTVRKM